MSMSEWLAFFEQPGPGNTDQTLEFALDRSRELGIREVVLASSTGDTAYKALESFKGLRLIVVTYHCGFKEPFQNTMQDDVRRDLKEEGVQVVRATHALSGVERSIAKKYGGTCPALLMADTLRLFGQGTKVAVEIAVMAADAGTLSGGDIVAIGGTGRGADTAVVLRPANQSNLFDLQIREIICKPRSF
ncbi:MAG: pyruvate kinase alpha/beta domain-containing protein [Desulfosalsimonadaceae bacterium]